MQNNKKIVIVILVALISIITGYMSYSYYFASQWENKIYPKVFIHGKEKNLLWQLKIEGVKERVYSKK